MSLYHIEIHVSNVKASEKFYDLLLHKLGFNKYLSFGDSIGYTDGKQSIIFAEADVEFLHYGFNRKRIGLNHIAFKVNSKEEVDYIYNEIALPNRMWVLYGGPQTFQEYHPEYYALYLEDPDKIKIEICYVPEPHHPMKESEE
jgi:catechol 2,3-dioxygenase-like lactoylglutathione lyase family enzyme